MIKGEKKKFMIAYRAEVFKKHYSKLHYNMIDDKGREKRSKVC